MRDTADNKSVAARRPTDISPKRKYPLALASRRITIRPARSIADLGVVLQLRHRGYKYFPSPAAALDNLDLADNAIILVAEHQDDGIVGTLRLVDGAGPVELDGFVELERIGNLEYRSFVEATRFAVKWCRYFETVKIMLGKAHWLYTLRQEKRFLLVSSKPEFADFYEHMLFAHVGPAGQYEHSALGMAFHETYCLHAATALNRYQAYGHRYHAFMADTEHAIAFE